MKQAIEKYIRYGNFKLSSGKDSNVYWDVKSVLFDKEALLTFTRALNVNLFTNGIKNFGGMEFGAVPLVFSTLLLDTYNGFVIRKQTKNYGLGGRVLSDKPLKGKTVIIDDVITTGETIDECVQLLKDEGHNVEISHAFCIVDRTKGSYNSYPIHSLFTESDFEK